MIFRQKRKGKLLEWQIDTDCLKTRHRTRSSEREFEVAYEHVSIHPTLSERTARKKSSFSLICILIGILSGVFALALLAGLINPTQTRPEAVVPFVVSSLMCGGLIRFGNRKQVISRFVTTAYKLKDPTPPAFWFFVPEPTELEALDEFLNQMIAARNAYLRKKYLPLIENATAAHQVHGLVITLLREKVISESEFQAFTERFDAKTGTIGFLS